MIFSHTYREPGSWRGWFRNGESIEVSWPRLGFGMKLYCYSPDDRYIGANVHLGPVNLFFPTPWPNKKRSVSEAVEFSGQGGKSWGFNTFDGAVHFNWGHKCRILEWPFINWVFISHEVQREDGSWAPYVGSWEKEKSPDGRRMYEFDYIYTLKNGEDQHRTASVYVERWTHRRKWLPRWFPGSLRTRPSISFEFDGEVGERTGSWKGGVIGSGETMLKGETVEQTFRRMERERKF